MSEYFSIAPNYNFKKRNFFMQWFSKLNITGWLIFVNVLVFLIILILSIYFKTANYFALQPKNLFEDMYFWTLLTSMFMHAGVFHLFVNMLSLFFIGSFLEMIIEKKRFFWFYIFSGIFAGLFFCIFAYFFGITGIGMRLFGSPETYAVGASGAIFGIAGVLAFLTPKNKVYLIAGPLIAIIIQALIPSFISSKSILSIFDLIISVYIFFCIFSMFSFRASKFSLPIKISFWLLPIVAIIPLFIIGLFFELPIGNTAHLGGFIAGIAYGAYLRIKYKKKTQIISDYFARRSG